MQSSAKYPYVYTPVAENEIDTEMDINGIGNGMDRGADLTNEQLELIEENISSEGDEERTGVERDEATVEPSPDNSCCPFSQQNSSKSSSESSPALDRRCYTLVMFIFLVLIISALIFLLFLSNNHSLSHSILELIQILNQRLELSLLNTPEQDLISQLHHKLDAIEDAAKEKIETPLFSDWHLCPSHEGGPIKVDFGDQEGLHAEPQYPTLLLNASSPHSSPLRFVLMELEYDRTNGDILLYFYVDTIDRTCDSHFYVPVFRNIFNKASESMLCIDSISKTTSRLRPVEIPQSNYLILACPWLPYPLPPPLDRQMEIAVILYSEVKKDMIRKKIQLADPSTTEYSVAIQEAKILFDRTKDSQSAYSWFTAADSSYRGIASLVGKVCVYTGYTHDFLHCSGALRSPAPVPYILDFIRYHAYLGVSKFAFYDRDGDYQDILEPYAESGLVDYRLVPTLKFTHGKSEYQDYDQKLILEMCYIQYKNRAKFILIWDTDEFLVFPQTPPGPNEKYEKIDLALDPFTPVTNEFPAECMLLQEKSHSNQSALVNVPDTENRENSSARVVTIAFRPPRPGHPCRSMLQNFIDFFYSFYGLQFDMYQIHRQELKAETQSFLSAKEEWIKTRRPQIVQQWSNLTADQAVPITILQPICEGYDTLLRQISSPSPSPSERAEYLSWLDRCIDHLLRSTQWGNVKSSYELDFTIGERWSLSTLADPQTKHIFRAAGIGCIPDIHYSYCRYNRLTNDNVQPWVQILHLINTNRGALDTSEEMIEQSSFSNRRIEAARIQREMRKRAPMTQLYPKNLRGIIDTF